MQKRYTNFTMSDSPSYRDKPPPPPSSTLSPLTTPTPSEISESAHQDSLAPEPPAKRVKYSPFPEDSSDIDFQAQDNAEDRSIEFDRTVEFAGAYEPQEGLPSIPGVSEEMEDEEMKEADDDAYSEISLAEEDETTHHNTKHLLKTIGKLELTIQMLQFKGKCAGPKYEKSQASLQKITKECDALSITNSKLTQDIQFLNQRLPKIREAEKLQRELEAVMGRNMFLQMQVENLKREREETVRRVVSLERELGGIKAQTGGRRLPYAEFEKRTYLTCETVGGLGNGDGTREGGGYIEGSFSIRKHRNHKAPSVARGGPTLVEWQGEVKKMSKEERDREMAALARKMQVLRLMDGKPNVGQTHLR